MAMIRNRFNQTTPWFVVCAFIFSLSAVRSTPELTLDDLRKLEIICFVPSYLPKGFRLQRIDITYDEAGPDESKRQFPLYSIIYSNEPRNGATFSIESAREGIGDRNIMEEEDTEETKSQGPGFASHSRPVSRIFRNRDYTRRIHKDHSITSPDSH